MFKIEKPLKHQRRLGLRYDDQQIIIIEPVHEISNSVAF